MDVRELVAFLNKLKCWIPKSNQGLRTEIDNVIQRLKQGH